MNERDLKVVALKHQQKLKKIKVLLFDIDGVLTDGRISYDGDEVGFNRSTHTHDGYGMKMMMSFGLKVGVISGGDSVGVKKRFAENLSLDYVFLGNEDKREAFNKVMADGFLAEEILYMGDEFFDLPLLLRSGFSATVPDAPLEVRDRVDYITERSSGMACAREVMEIVRFAKKLLPEILDFDGRPLNLN